jgi:CRP-like cAMP-binding protein
MASERFDQEFFVDILLGLIPDLPPAAASLLGRTCSLQKYEAGDLIIREGEPSNGIFLLIFGTVQPSISDGVLSSKGQINLHRISAPAVLGIAGSVLAQPSPYTVTAVTSTECGFISQYQIGNILKDSPQAGLAFAHVLANELASTYTHLGQLRCPDQPAGANSQLN